MVHWPWSSRETPLLCPACGDENGPSRRFCRACGAALAPVCRACATLNEPGDRFCGSCGASLTSGPSPAPAAPPAPIASQTPAPEPLGSPATPAGDPEEWRPVTVLFADIVGFTAMSERLDAETVREITTECFRRLVPEVTRYEGTIDKFMGDAVMALFGAPTTHEDDPARAL